jgi:fucose permease
MAAPWLRPRGLANTLKSTLYSDFIANYRALSFSELLSGSISSCLMLLCAFPSGFLVQKYGMRAVALCGTALMFVGLMLASQVSQLWQMYLTYGVINGVGFSLLWSAANVAVNRFGV